MSQRPNLATCRCGRPVDGTTLCKTCRHTLDVALGNIPTYYADLETSRTRTRAVRYDLPRRGSGGTREMPLPADSRFLPGGTGALAMAQARNTITTWCRIIGEEHPTWPGPCRDTIGVCCGWLQTHLGVITTAVWAAEAMRDLLDVERMLYRVDARGPERIYAGECTICLAVHEHSPLYALPGDEWVTCQALDCGMEYRVQDRRNLMLDALEYEWMTPAKIADVATYLQLLGDREWVRKKLNRWHSDGLLRAAGIDLDGTPRFPFGEASRMLMTADSYRRATRKGA